MLGIRSKFSREETQTAVDAMEKFVAEARQGKHITPNTGRGLVMPNNFWEGLGTTTFENLAEAEKHLAGLKEVLAGGGDSGPRDKLTAMTANATEMAR